MTRAIIFDLDGTLVDSRADLARAGNQARQALGLAPLGLDEVTRFVGDGVDKLVERLTPACSDVDRARARAAFLTYYGAHCTDATRPYPGIDAMLARLYEGGWLLAVATNKPLVHTRAILASCGLDHVTAVRGGDAARKPDPGQLLSILAELDADPGASWMVGDHRTDILAGRAAGCRVLWCSWGFGQRDGLDIDAQAAHPDDVVRLTGG